MSGEIPSAWTEPIAVVGMGCRFPGHVESPEQLWQLLTSGRTVVGPIPSERWVAYRNRNPESAAAVGRAVGRGSFLEDVASFDADFFGISPREAELMDPQQRILLEVVWQALEHAGISPSSLAGTDAAVFAGVCNWDYGIRQLEDLPGVEAWTGIGAALSAVSGRISHVLDLRGPSMSIDTACSASLVSIHLACQSLRSRESTLALACGVNVILTPGDSISLTDAGALAVDGRSKAFDASADGYGRAEGCGVLVLKRLSDSQRDGDQVLALVAGSAVNQDGHTEGIMAPSQEAQERVTRRAVQAAGIDPASVDYVEAHGTGTELGDPIEAATIGAVYGKARQAGAPCLVGSVKANIGHSEGAAGVAGVIKAVLALQHGEIPHTPLVTGINPNIPWSELGLQLVDEHRLWPVSDHPRRCGVSGFGYSGTVAHVILEQAPARLMADDPDEPAKQTRVFVVSASSAGALRQRAADLADAIAADDALSLPMLADTLARRRTHLRHRGAVVADNRDELIERLRGLSTGTPMAEAVGGIATLKNSSLVWVFSGHGSQWAGMGRDLLAADPVFARTIDELGPVFASEIDFTPREAIIDGDFGDVDRAQAMLFAMQIALARSLQSRGVRPDAVIGHSVGEIAAATVAGVLSQEDGARLICRRSVLLRKVAGQGAMAMVDLPFDVVVERLAGRADLSAAIAAAPHSCVISGEPDGIDELLTAWTNQGIDVRLINSDVAFHSPHMDPLLADLAAAAAGLTPHSARIPMFSTTLTDPHAPVKGDSQYWSANLRNPVRLTGAIQAAVQAGHRAFMEVSPHPVVVHSILETLAELGIDDEDAYVGLSLRRDEPELRRLWVSLANAHCHGVPVDWSRSCRRYPPATLPGYPWQHRKLWREPAGMDSSAGRGHDLASRTLLGTPVSIAGSTVRMWQTSLTHGTRPYHGSHALNGLEIMPASVLVTTFFDAAGSDVGRQPVPADVGTSAPSEQSIRPVLRNLSLRHPLLTMGRQHIQVVAEGDRVRLAARPAEQGDHETAGEPAWLIHADAEIADAEASARSLQASPRFDPVAARLRLAETNLVDNRLAEVGAENTAFDWTIRELQCGRNVIRAEVSIGETTNWATVLDAVMTICIAVYPGEVRLRTIAHIDEALIAVAEPPAVVTVEITLDDERPDVSHGLVVDGNGAVIAAVRGIECPVIDQPHAPLSDSASSPEQLDPNQLIGLSSDQLTERVLAELADIIATEMRIPVADLDLRRPLLDQGLDSIMKMVIRRRLEKRFSLSLSATVFWRRPTIAALAEHVLEALREREPAS